MRNIAPTRALERRARHFLQGAFSLIAGGVFLAAVGLFLTAVPLVAKESGGFGLYTFFATVLFFGGGIIALGGLGLGLRAFLWARNSDNQLAKIVANAFAPSLGDEYTFIRNVNRFGLGYIDAVLVGPPGALVFRITDKEGIFLNEGDRWLRANKNREWVPAGIDATREAVADIKALREYAVNNKLPEIPVYGVVVFVRESPRVEITLKEPLIPATQLSATLARLQTSYFAKNRIDNATAAALVKLLCPV